MQPAEEGTGELLVCGADLAEALPVQRGAPEQILPLRGTPHWAELAGPFHHHPAQSLVVTVKKRGFSGGSAVKDPPANAGDVGSIPGSGRSPTGGEMATHSSILAWEIPLTEEPGAIMGSQNCLTQLNNNSS